MSFWVNYYNMLEFHYNRKFIRPLCSDYDEEWDEVNIVDIMWVTYSAVIITLFIAWWKVPLSFILRNISKLTTVKR